MGKKRLLAPPCGVERGRWDGQSAEALDPEFAGQQKFLLF
jgi:hypothetical protein